MKSLFNDLKNPRGKDSYSSPPGPADPVPNAEDAIVAPIDPHIQEEYIKLKTLIAARASGERPLRSLMVIGSVRGEGVSTVAITLAQAMAMGKTYPTLLVDIDLGTPSIHKYLGLANEFGISELLSSTSPFEQAIQKTQNTDLWVLTAGKERLDVSNILKTARFREFMGFARDHFAYVIFDASPVKESFDGLVFGSALDSCLFVVHADRTPINVVQSARKQLAQARIDILGIVLNRKKYYVPKFIFKDYDD